MSRFTVRTNCGTSREFERRREAERGRETHAALREECDESDVDIEAIAGRPDDSDDGPASTDDGPASTDDGPASTASAAETPAGAAWPTT